MYKPDTDDQPAVVLAGPTGFAPAPQPPEYNQQASMIYPPQQQTIIIQQAPPQQQTIIYQQAPAPEPIIIYQQEPQIIRNTRIRRKPLTYNHIKGQIIFSIINLVLFLPLFFLSGFALYKALQSRNYWKLEDRVKATMSFDSASSLNIICFFFGKKKNY